MSQSIGSLEIPEDFSTEEFLNLRFRLRDDLNVSLQSYGGVACYIVEDNVNCAYFRIGESEYEFVSLLDGKHTISYVIALLSSANLGSSLSEEKANLICRWLADNQLVHCSRGFSPEIQERHRTGLERQISTKPSILYPFP
jgi:hypothetical protein